MSGHLIYNYYNCVIGIEQSHVMTKINTTVFFSRTDRTGNVSNYSVINPGGIYIYIYISFI